MIVHPFVIIARNQQDKLSVARPGGDGCLDPGGKRKLNNGAAVPLDLSHRNIGLTRPPFAPFDSVLKPVLDHDYGTYGSTFSSVLKKLTLKQLLAGKQVVGVLVFTTLRNPSQSLGVKIYNHAFVNWVGVAGSQAVREEAERVATKVIDSEGHVRHSTAFHLLAHEGVSLFLVSRPSALFDIQI